MTPTSEQTKKTHKRTFTGVVVSDAMNKTISVRVDSIKKNEKYDKQYVRSRNYHVHDEKGSHKIGDAVTFVECRPLSKTKRWRVVYGANK